MEALCRAPRVLRKWGRSFNFPALLTIHWSMQLLEPAGQVVVAIYTEEAVTTHEEALDCGKGTEA